MPVQKNSFVAIFEPLNTKHWGRAEWSENYHRYCADISCIQLFRQPRPLGGVNVKDQTGQPSIFKWLLKMDGLFYLGKSQE